MVSRGDERGGGFDVLRVGTWSDGGSIRRPTWSWVDRHRATGLAVVPVMFVPNTTVHPALRERNRLPRCDLTS